MPPEAWAKTLHVVFSMIAARRGPHWKLAVLPAEMNPLGTGAVDEAATMGEAISNVMKYVPVPAKQLGVVNDVGTLVFVMYAAINMRLQLDKQFAAQIAQQRAGARVAAAAPAQAEVTGHHEPPATSNGEVTAADVMEGLTRAHEAPLAAVTHGAPQTGDPVADGVQLGRSVTILQSADEDPEPALLDAFRPGATPARIEDLAATGDGKVLDRLAPPIEVEGSPAARELSDGQ